MSASWKEHKEGDEGVQRVERRETERGEKVTAGQLSWCFVASKSTGGEEKAFRDTSKVSVCVCQESQWLNPLQKRNEPVEPALEWETTERQSHLKHTRTTSFPLVIQNMNSYHVYSSCEKRVYYYTRPVQVLPRHRCCRDSTASCVTISSA